MHKEVIDTQTFFLDAQVPALKQFDKPAITDLRD